MKKIYEHDSRFKADLESKFRQHDPTNQGVIKKNDFTDIIFESVKGLKVTDFMNFLSLFSLGTEDIVNYIDFLKILYKFGDIPVVPQGLTPFQ